MGCCSNPQSKERAVYLLKVITDVFAKIISVVAEIGHDPSFFPGCLENKQMADILLRAVARQRLEIYGV